MPTCPPSCDLLIHPMTNYIVRIARASVSILNRKMLETNDSKGRHRTNMGSDTERKKGGGQPSEFKDVQIVKYSEMQGPPEA